MKLNNNLTSIIKLDIYEHRKNEFTETLKNLSRHGRSRDFVWEGVRLKFIPFEFGEEGG